MGKVSEFCLIRPNAREHTTGYLNINNKLYQVLQSALVSLLVLFIANYRGPHPKWKGTGMVTKKNDIKIIIKTPLVVLSEPHHIEIYEIKKGMLSQDIWTTVK